MVRNMKIKSLLILSFALVLTIMGVLGGCASFFTQKLANQSISFYENPHTVQLEIAEVRLTMAEIGSKIKEAIINKTDESTKETTAYITTGLETMNAHIAVVKERFLGEKSLLDTADAQVATWLGAIEQLRIMMEAGQYGKAVEYFNSDYLKIETAMEEACIQISEDSGVRTLAVYEQAKRSKVISTIAISVMIAVAIIMTIIVCGKILRSILTPLRKIQASSDALSKGQLHQQVDFSGTNEFGQLAASMNHTIDTLATYVDNIDEALDRMSNNDMTVTIDLDYVGDFASIKTSMQQIAAALNKALHQIYICSDQVANSSEMLSAGAQNLSQGASEQSSSVEELSAGVTEISVQVTQNASYSNEARQLVERVGAELESGNQKMGQMLSAISEINNASDQIAKIIKTIEDIAFQTNILALNAAVEAARAGEAGKGFAVVADEVRNLASKSSEAAKSTTALIQNSIHAVENGTNIADDTAATLKSVVSGAERITQMISHIAEASETQANSLSQVTSSINQISQVIQTNSATAEESAAASEEMSSQSRILESLVRKFKLLNN